MFERMWRKGKPCTLLVGIYIGTATVENSIEVPQKTKNRTTILSSNSTHCIYLEKMKTVIQKDACTRMLIAVLLTIAKT